MSFLKSIFNSDNKQQSEKKTAIDVCMKLLSLGKKNGYVYDDKSFPNIPEIMVQAVPVVKEFLAQFLIEPNPNPSLMCAWACYAGMGAVWKWDEDWDALKQNGIFATLVTPRGLDEMDEFVTDGIGWKFGSKKSDDFVNHLHLTSAVAISESTKNAVGDNKLQSVVDAMVAMYYYGMIIEMNELGMH